MADPEKLGSFYIGRTINSSDQTQSKTPLLFSSKDLTTHAVCVGMTGSGKTGLGIVLLEEAGLDNIPAIIVDPKGDLADLMLTFPGLSAQEFLPWVDATEAKQSELNPQAYAEQVANSWKEGLKSWDEDGKRIQTFKDRAEVAIYTPASEAGIPISILNSFAAPPKDVLDDSGALRDKILSLTSSVLGLIGIDADPIKSREAILISTLIEQGWRQGDNLTIPTLIQQVQKPPFNKIGALDVDTFFPVKDRMALSISLNNLLASPGFQAWMKGEPLDIQNLLYTKEGKPRLAVLSIAHLGDSERMFFVTLLLNELLTWIRRQPGTSNLRALFYMDEIYGYFPPTAMPPSKLPMITLLKQARAYGLGIILATQNPVDLDYKGLSNCGTWFIGKLQTERDKARVLEGLATASNGEIDRVTLDQQMSQVGKRTFLMRSIHQKDPVLFQTRWTLSYLRGPLTQIQIRTLMEGKRPILQTAPSETAAALQKTVSKPITAMDLREAYLNLHQNSSYKPHLAAFAKLHYVDAKAKVDLWENVCLIVPISSSDDSIQWEKGENIPEIGSRLEPKPLTDANYTDLPSFLSSPKALPGIEKSCCTYLYQHKNYELYKYEELGLTSTPEETELEFLDRVKKALREKRDADVLELQKQYGGKIASMTEKLAKAQQKLAASSEKVTQKRIETIISFGTTLLGALFGKKITKGTINSAGSTIKQAGRMTKQSQTAAQSEETVESIQTQLEDLKEQQRVEIDKVSSGVDFSNIKLETVEIPPKKSDILIEQVSLVWINKP